MAHPKRRISNQRKHKRRTHDKVEEQQISVCSNCGAPVLYHRVCTECGSYRGSQAIVKETNL
jgi:large subunit ribosomal protein L32